MRVPMKHQPLGAIPIAPRCPNQELISIVALELKPNLENIAPLRKKCRTVALLCKVRSYNYEIARTCAKKPKNDQNLPKNIKSILNLEKKTLRAATGACLR